MYQKVEHFPEVIQDPNQIITSLQAFVATQKLVDIYYFDTETSADLGGLGGYMTIFESDGGTADPAMWGDWLDAIEVVLKKEDKEKL